MVYGAFKIAVINANNSAEGGKNEGYKDERSRRSYTLTEPYSILTSQMAEVVKKAEFGELKSYSKTFKSGYCN